MRQQQYNFNSSKFRKFCLSWTMIPQKYEMENITAIILSLQMYKGNIKIHGDYKVMPGYKRRY